MTVPKEAGTAHRHWDTSPDTLQDLPHATGPLFRCAAKTNKKQALSSLCYVLLAGRKESRKSKRQQETAPKSGGSNGKVNQALLCSLVDKAISSLTHRKPHIPAEGKAVCVALRGSLVPSDLSIPVTQRWARPRLCLLYTYLPPSCPFKASPQGPGQASRVPFSPHGTGHFSHFAPLVDPSRTPLHVSSLTHL